MTNDLLINSLKDQHQEIIHYVNDTLKMLKFLKLIDYP